MKRRPLGPVLITLLLTAVMVVPRQSAAERQVDEPQLDEEVIWLNAERQRLLFVPQVVLDNADLEDLPAGLQESLTLRLDVQRRPELYRRSFRGGRVPDCWPAEPSQGQGTGKETRSLEALLEDFENVFVGTVLQVVAGWDVRQRRVAQLVVVRIDERFVAKEAEDSHGQEVGVLVEGGRIDVGGTTLCNRFREELHRPQVGDHVLLAGGSPEGNSDFFEGYLFPIEAGKIQPQPFPALSADQEAVGLDVLGEILRDERRQDVRPPE